MTTSTSTSTSTTPPPITGFFDGFETGDFSNWDDAWGSVQGDVVYTGDYAAAIDPMDDGYIAKFPGAFSEIYLRLMFRAHVLPVEGVCMGLIGFYSQNGPSMDYGLYKVIGEYYLMIHDGYDYEKILIDISPDEWYSLRVHIFYGEGWESDATFDESTNVHFYSGESRDYFKVISIYSGYTDFDDLWENN